MNEQPNMAFDDMPQSSAREASRAGLSAPMDDPTVNHIGTYEAQFEAIREMVKGELQETGAEYAMSVKTLVDTCIAGNMQISTLAKMHCMNILAAFRACNAKLVNYTNSNALYSIDGKSVLVEFDLDRDEHSILTAKKMQPSVYDGALSIQTDLILLRQLQTLMLTKIDEANIVIPYRQSASAVSTARKKLEHDREVLRANILSRANTAFDFTVGLSLYTLNFSDDMSMLFWDRYTIIDVTAKSYYVEQHCIVQHTITGDIEPERFIELHKPSKNSMAQFLSDRLACLTDLVRPEPTIEVKKKEITSITLPGDDALTADEDAEDFFSYAELLDMGWSEDEIEQYRINHPMSDEQWNRQLNEED